MNDDLPNVIAVMYSGHIDDPPPRVELGKVICNVGAFPWRSPLIGIPMSFYYCYKEGDAQKWLDIIGGDHEHVG